MGFYRLWWCICVAMLLVADAVAQDLRVLNPDVHFPEGPVWSHGKLYYVEYDRNTVTVWDGHSNAIFITDPGCGPSAVIVNRAGEFLTTCYDNHSIGRFKSDGSPLPRYTRDKDGHKLVAPNDFAPDAQGGIYFTDSGHEGAASDARVFYIGPDGKVSLAADHLRSANGLALSPDGRTLYVIETENHRLLEFDVAGGGALSNRRVFVDLDELTHHVVSIWPDGMKINSKGEIFIGQDPRDVHAPLVGEIFVLDAQARLVRTVKLPTVGVPNLAFSPDEKTLYVTALDQIDKVPHAGKIYAVPSM
jgi:gluconolactonase